ncbi:GntR family transcriptional regulator [Rhizobium sp. PP-F2F-G38]|nr:GntR family transcriptional regulator [Rhizobium sp. PP-WC-1G-195]PYE92116.1 GntR family transcriptional regulator [Rhizobium sp. PP-F2F-G38]
MSQTRRRESLSAAFLPQIDLESEISLVRQLYLSLRNAIMAGRLGSGHRLPSTRLAAKEWKLSRGSVAEAYEILIAEGYASARLGSGTYVSPGLPDVFSQPDNSMQPGTDSPCRTVSVAAAKALSLATSLETPKQLPFATGRIVHDERTTRLLSRIAGRYLNYSSDGYGDIQGEVELRSAIVAYLTASRGVRCTNDQVFITSGTQQALDLAFRVLVTPGDTVFVEDPCYPPARHALILQGAKIVGYPVDRDGLITEALVRANVDPPALIYVTPSHQYPSGAALPLTRRLELLSYARENGCWIIEDDYDSEFRYDGHSIASLQGLDQANRVIYAGTFSKSLLPSLRVGYLVVPPDLTQVFRAVRPILDRFPPVLPQRIVADFLNEGYFPAHLRRLRERHRASRDLLAHLLQERMGDHLSASSPEQGIHLTVRSAGIWSDDVAVSNAAQKRGVIVIPISPMHVSGSPAPGLMLGFSGLSEQEADIGTQWLARMFDQERFQ